MAKQKNQQIVVCTRNAALSIPSQEINDQFNIGKKKLGHRTNVTNSKAIYGLDAHGRKLLLATEDGGIFIDLDTAQHREFLAGEKLLCVKIIDQYSALFGGEKGLYSVNLLNCNVQWHLPVGLVHDLVVAQDRRQAMACLQNHAVAIVDISAGKLNNLLTPTRGIARCIAIDADSGVFVSGHLDCGSKLVIWLRGEAANVLPHSGRVRTLALHNNQLYVPEYMGMIQVWELNRAPQIKRVLSIKGSCINCLAISKDGRHLVAGDESGQVSIVNLPSNDVEILDQYTGKVTDVGFIYVDDGTVLYSCAAGTVRFRDLDGRLLLTYHSLKDSFLFESPPDQLFPSGKFYTKNEEALVEVFEKSGDAVALEKTNTLSRAYLSIHNDPKVLLKISDRKEEKIRKAKFQILAGFHSVNMEKALKLLPTREQKDKSI